MKSVSSGRFEREFNSDSNRVLDSLARIEETAKYAAEQTGRNIDSIYETFDFDPISYLLDSRNDSFLKDTEQYAIEAIQGIVPAEHRKYGGRMKNFIADDNAILSINFGGNPATTEGEIKKVEKRGIVEGIIDWIGRHPYLSAGGLITLFAGGIAANEYQNNKKFASAVDSGISKAKAEISAGASGVLGFIGKIGNQPPVIESISVNNTHIYTGDTVRFEAKAFDPDGDAITYNWHIMYENGHEVMAKTTLTPVLENVFDKPEKYIVELEAVDEKGESYVKFEKVDVVRPFLMYDGIKIIGDEEFQKDVVMTLEFGKKYSLPDYEFIKENTKEINFWYGMTYMGAGNGKTTINKSVFHDFIQNVDGGVGIKRLVSDETHESWHNYADFNDPNNNTEEIANKRSDQTWRNLSYVNQSEIDKFYQEFDFSQFKK